ncbi:MAG: hypothetical protein IGS03_16170 [Candidatus Sericytochromatia bacterium]|nr:hypothetical protein [Candidatus Sericytochromatia bacterium]
MLKRKLILAALGVCLLGVGGVFPAGVIEQATAQAASQTPPTVTIDAVTGEGMSSDAARLDAFRNAISQAVGVFVRADTTVQDYVTQSDKVRTSSQGFIKSFKKLQESKGPDGVFTAVYQVVVSTQPLQADVQSVVGAEFRNVGHPTVAVVGWFQGRDRAETEVNSIAVAALNRALIQRGYKVRDASEVARLRKEDKDISKAAGLSQPNNFDQVAQMIANRLKADIYVTTFGSVGQGKASVATRMYNAYTGQIFGSETGYGTVRGGNLSDHKKAVDDAITTSMKTVLNQVSNHWQDVLTNGQEFIVVLDGFKEAKQRRAFSKALAEATGVTDVKTLMAAGGRAEFSVYASAEPFDLFDEIIELAGVQGLKFVKDEAVVRGGRAVFVLR